MITPKLLEYVQTQIAAGVQSDAIRRSLVINGWKDEDIDAAFASLTPPTQASSEAVPERQSYFVTKALLSSGLIIASGAYVLWHYLGGQQPVAGTFPTTVESTTSQPVVTSTTPPVTAAPPVQNPSPNPVPIPVTPTPAPVPQPAPQPVKPAGLYADGTYTGSTADAYYGLVQVQAVVKNGALANVKFLQYPSDRSTSRYINSQAMPMLTQEAIQAQNANVDIISGATFTSQAFQQSLAVALANAKN